MATRIDILDIVLSEVNMINNLPQIHIALNSGNLNYEFQLLREHFLVVHRNPRHDAYPFTIQYDAEEHNHCFEYLVALLGSFRDSKNRIISKSRQFSLNPLTMKYELLKE